MKNILFIIFIISFGITQSQNKSDLNIEQIMQGESFIGYSPKNVFWSEDSKIIYFDWNPESKPINSLYKYTLTTQKIEKVSISEEKTLPLAYQYDYNKNKDAKIYANNGDIYINHINLNKNELLVNTFNDRESNPKFLNDNLSFVYEKNRNLFISKMGKTVQITNFRKGIKSNKDKDNQQQKWLQQQQIELFNVLKDRKTKKDLRSTRSKLLKIKESKVIYLKGKRITNIKLSKNEGFVTYKLVKSSKNERVKIPHFVNDNGYTKIQNTNSKVGGKSSINEFWILDLQKDSTYQVDYSNLTRIYNTPKYLENYPNYKSKSDEPRKVNFFGPFYNKNGTSAVIEIKAQDNKDRWYAKLDLTTGKLTELNNQHDDAWIGGPGIPWWNSSKGNSGWLNNKQFWFHSEVSGFSHLYKVNVNSGKIKALTKGAWEVHHAELKNSNSLNLTTNEENTGERHLYKLNTSTLKRTKITQETGNHEITISPNGKYFADLFSFSNKPWELFVQHINGDNRKQITVSTTNEFNSYDWRIPEMVKFTANDGKKVTARLYKAKNGTQNKPAIIFVHGAGYLQNAHKWWSGYYREYLFHNFLADNGYTVLDIDFRASKGYGRDWRTAIYRHMGGKDLSDQVDGAKYLVDKLGVDKDNIGIYGGSYGGFITLMALFNASDTFKSGAAIRSVTDWAHYNHGYTSNILNTPILDSLAYQKSSPINFANGLKGNLLILHGMVDDNVHMQDVIRLSQRLIELKKENWEMALYPVEKHGFVEPSSWTDEYKRIFKLFEETLK